MPASTQAIPYFPPPPTSSALATKSKSKASSSSTKPAIAAKIRLSPLQRSRTVVLPFLLILTFAIFVLAIIYGYCVAKPHTQLTPAQLASNSTVELDSSIFSRHKRSPIFYNPIPASVIADIVAKNNATLSTSSGRTRYNSNEKLSASLLFYLLTSPALLVTLLSTELVLQLSSPGILTGHRAHLTLLFTHAISLIGFIISSSFWTACELPGPQTTALKHICPAQVRGHFMYGIHELSIAKAAMAWCIVAGLLWHMLCLVRSIKGNRRVWALQKEEHGEVQEITIKMEEGLVQEGWEQRERKRDRVVRFLK